MNLEIAEQLQGEKRNEYFAICQALESAGWPIVQAVIENSRDTAASLKMQATTWDHNRVAHGAHEALSYILTYLENIDDVYREFMSRGDDDADPEQF